MAGRRPAGPVPRAVLVAAVLLTGGWCAAGCAHESARPDAAVRAFVAAVERGDLRRAYGLLSDDYRRRVSFDAFRAEADARSAGNGKDGPAGPTLASAVTAATATPVAAVVALPGQDRVELRWTPEGWRLIEPPLLPFSQHSPRAALRSFVRAVSARRYDVLLRFVPERQRKLVTERALQAFWEGPGSEARKPLMNALQRSLDAPIDEDGNHARLQLAGYGDLRFIRENGVWKVEDAG